MLDCLGPLVLSGRCMHTSRFKYAHTYIHTMQRIHLTEPEEGNRSSVEDSRPHIREYKGNNMGKDIEQKIRAIVFPDM